MSRRLGIVSRSTILKYVFILPAALWISAFTIIPAAAYSLAQFEFPIRGKHLNFWFFSQRVMPPVTWLGD
jgi:hypothetical protein